MQSLNKYRAIIFTSFTTLMYFIWNHADFFSSEIFLTKLFFSVITSYGTYEILLKLLEFAAEKLKGFKRFIFAGEYLEGSWVGCFLGTDGNPQYFIETFEQDFSGLIIRGRNYYDNGNFKGTWLSEKVSVDVEKGRLSYTYITDMVNNTYSNRGFGDFSFIRTSATNPPYKLIGFTTDLFNNKKCFSVEERIEIKGIENDHEIILKAKEVFESNKDLFLTNQS